MVLPDGASSPDILISECGPRDGLQILSQIMPTEAKKRWIAALHAAGLREIEVCSFVPAKLMPQMADAAEIVAFASTLPGLTVLALVPNLRGAEAALAAGAHKLTIPVSGSEEHSLANVRRTRAEMVEEVRRIVDYRNAHAPHVPVEANISVAFGCTIAGPVSEDEVTRLCVSLVEAGVDDSGLSDTTGMGNPVQVKRLFTRVIGEIGEKIGAAHMHNTRGLGLANVLAAYEAGVRIFDSSHAGLGGCPHAPGASGNVVTEDLVFMFEAMGVKTGVDAASLVRSRAILSETLPGAELYGMLAGAGLPKGYRPASPGVMHGQP
ncbi:MAG: hydroxymethylglutaryl-CoA lyase [Beijerinckiaceae bacterium]|jgi:hydroxymethylglutaryl-CoA lyase|nr:hydroxymethylglutaryl-CoA lyase [Beijerinckiaceae bacterium]